MSNKSDFAVQPEKLFLNPWRDSGLRLLSEPDFYWRPMTPAVIEGFAVSEHTEINEKIEFILSQAKQQSTFQHPIEYNSVPIVLENARFRGSFKLTNKRYVLSGKSGARALNRYRWENTDADFDAESLVTEFLVDCRDANAGRRLPMQWHTLPKNTPMAIECRNTSNYYQFVTESLSQLAILAQLDLNGPIYFHYPNNDDVQRPFAQAFVQALFPELLDRIMFERAPKDYKKVITVFDMVGAHFQMPSDLSDPMERYTPDGRLWQGGRPTVLAQSILSMNIVNSGLLALRQRALAAINGKDFDHLPRRFYVGRDNSQSKARPMRGEDALLEELWPFGFEYVEFEVLSPLEQIALMARAEMMISYYGAGFTNTLFANPNAMIIEIGTLQTAQARWGDLWPLVHAAQCKCISFFADFHQDDPLREPDFDEDGIVPVALSGSAISKILAFVRSMLGPQPELSCVEDMRHLMQMVSQVGAYDQLDQLFKKHRKMVQDDAQLCLIMADSHKRRGQPQAELSALDAAFHAQPGNFQVLERMVWCARRCDRPQVIRWALSQLKLDFPDRHADLVGKNEWVRFMA